jgi:hypothetical protein
VALVPIRHFQEWVIPPKLESKLTSGIFAARVRKFSVVPCLFLNDSRSRMHGPCLYRQIHCQHSGAPRRTDQIRDNIVNILREVENVVTRGFETARPGAGIQFALNVPVHGPPDVPICISRERPRHYARPDVMLAGRVNGNVIGSVSILSVLHVVAKSMEIARQCDGTCAVVQGVRNISASEWAKGPVLDPDNPVCVQMDGDSAWRLLAAGQINMKGLVLMFGCFDYAVKAMKGREERGDIVISGTARLTLHLV